MKMKIAKVMMALLATLVSADPLSEGACTINLLAPDYNDWHDIVEGFIYGFYASPAEKLSDCAMCDGWAYSIAAVQTNIMELYSLRDEWMTLDYFNGLNIWEKGAFMMTLYLRFWAFGDNLRYQWESGLYQQLFDKIVLKFNSDFNPEITKHVETYWANSTLLIMTIPGHRCE